MKIALISYEYPPDTAFGGIATYADQMARLLRGRGHRVEVFSSAPQDARVEEDGIVVHRVAETDRFRFAEAVAPVFVARHCTVGFDVVEGPDYFADTRAIARLVPDVPIVLKTHSPSFVLWRATYGHNPLRLARSCLGALRRREMPPWHPRSGFEFRHAQEADAVAIPAVALAKRIVRAWRLDPKRVFLIPNPYVPSEELLRVPAETDTRVVTFLGRLSIQKGVVEFVRAVPWVLAELPDVRFRLVGGSTERRPGLTMEDYVRHVLGRHAAHVDFVGRVPGNRVPDVLRGTDVCAFPSYWESFPNVCLEAMAAARAIVASDAGGMPEMLAGETCGRIVPPRSPRRLARAIIGLLKDRVGAAQLGLAARGRLLQEYNADRIGELQERLYSSAIHYRRAIGARSAVFSKNRAA